MNWKYPFDAFAIRDAAHGEGLIEPSPLPSDYHPSKDLDALLIAFHDAGVHTHTIADRKMGGIVFLLLSFNGINDLIHNLAGSRAAAGAHCHSEAQVMQPEITLTGPHAVNKTLCKISVKISRICG